MAKSHEIPMFPGGPPQKTKVRRAWLLRGRIAGEASTLRASGIDLAFHLVQFQ
jgi:hypothetical protein